MGYGYDAADNPTRLVYPGGQVVTRTFDALDRPITLTDWLRKSTGFAYDANSNLLTQTYPNTTTANYGYDAMNRVTGIVDKAGCTPFWSYSYTRDALGRLTGAIDPLQALTHTYGYDRLNRLTSDQAGSVISATDTYNAAHDLIQKDAAADVTTIAACLEGVAAIASDHGQPDGAARLLGAAATLRDVSSAPLAPPDRADHAQTVVALRALLGEHRVTALWTVGAALSLEGAVDEALQAITMLCV